MAVSRYKDYVKSRFKEIEAWLNLGLSEKQIFTNLGVGKTSWSKYKNQNIELTDLIKKGRTNQVREVENALYKNATGYYYNTEESMKIKDKNGNETVQIYTLTKFKAPETGAIAFFLKNKAREDYMDNPNMIDLKREEIKIRKEQSEFKMF